VRAPGETAAREERETTASQAGLSRRRRPASIPILRLLFPLRASPRSDVYP